MRRKWTEDLNSWDGFEYLRLRGAPMKRTKEGPVIDMDGKKLQRLIAKGIVASQVPIQGKELKLLRAATELSMNELARRLGITGTAVYHWEKATKQRLSRINEIAVRLLCAEQLGVRLGREFSTLIGDPKHEPVTVQLTGKRPTKPAKYKTVMRPSYRGDRKVRVRV